MISNFGYQFSGHVDMDNLGLSGTPVNDRWLSDGELAAVFDSTKTIAQRLEDTGYDIFWLAEHHFQREGYECVPNILLLSAHLANFTKRIKFGCAINVTTMWHPLRLAEDFATVDILTGGRVIFGVGRGYQTREVECFGAPLLDKDANRDLFEEQVDIIFKAFNERSFSHHGKYYDIPPKVPYRDYELEEITLVPRPANLPVKCWQPIVSGNQRGIDFMIKHGMNGIVGGGVGVGSHNENIISQWRDALAKAGRETELGGDLLVGFGIHIADTQEKAIQEARKYHDEELKMLAPFGFYPGLTDEKIEALTDPRKAADAQLPTLEEAVESGLWLCGPPELLIERLQEIQDRFPGLEHVYIQSALGTPEDVYLEQLEWFGREVIPAFKGKVTAAVASD